MMGECRKLWHVCVAALYTNAEKNKHETIFNRLHIENIFYTQQKYFNNTFGRITISIQTELEAIRLITGTKRIYCQE